MEDQSITPLIPAQIRSVMNVVGHEIGNLEDRGCFIWETSLHFAGDVINKWVKYIPTEACFCCISFSIRAMLLAIRGG